MIVLRLRGDSSFEDNLTGFFLKVAGGGVPAAWFQVAEDLRPDLQRQSKRYNRISAARDGRPENGITCQTRLTSEQPSRQRHAC